MVLPIGIEDTIVALNANVTNLSTLQTQIDALPASPPTDDLVPIVQSLKDIASSINTNLTTFIDLIKTVRVNP